MKKSKPIGLSRVLRKNQTDAEHQLWMILRNHQFEGWKFRRQQPLGKYIVDFVSFDAKLIIEVDGGQHNQLRNLDEDAHRSKFLEQQGFRVIRFWNSDVLQNLEGVASNILEAVGNSGTLT
jgi:very-short-patch-repair endonuclease